MKPPARAIVGHLIWGVDGGVWALWRVSPFPHGLSSTAAKLGSHTRLRGLLIALPAESMLLSVCERIDPWDVVADMTTGIDTDNHLDWAEVCQASATQLAELPLHGTAARGGDI